MVNTIKEDKTQSGENKVKETKLKDYFKNNTRDLSMQRFVCKSITNRIKKIRICQLLFKQLDEYNYVQKNPKTVSDI